MSRRTLKVKCPTWNHVENFYGKKVRAGNILAARVPFEAIVGEQMAIAIELPSELVLAIDCTIRDAQPTPDGRKYSVVLALDAMTQVRQRLEALVAEGRAGQDVQSGGYAPRLAMPTPRLGRTPSVELPVPIPIDAPIDELIEPPPRPHVADVAEAVRAEFQALETKLLTVRERAAHDVLGIDWDAGVDEIRSAYFALVKEFHPDVLWRHQSPAIAFLAQEVFICINAAYDRMRDAAVARGVGIVAGPALIKHKGWLAGFEDLGTAISDRAATAPRPQPADASSALPGPVKVRFGAKPAKRKPPQAEVLASSAPGLSEADLFDDVDVRPSRVSSLDLTDTAGRAVTLNRLTAEAQAHLARESWGQAQTSLAQVLEIQPRNRELRALYHFAYGQELLALKKSVEAQAQFEAALIHDSGCERAKQAIKKLSGPPRRGILGRLFR